MVFISVIIQLSEASNGRRVSQGKDGKSPGGVISRHTMDQLPRMSANARALLGSTEQLNGSGWLQIFETRLGIRKWEPT
jgi:hypothetical protein